MGFLSDLFGGAGKTAARANMGLLNGFETKANQQIDAGSGQAQDYLGQAGDIYSGLADRSLGNLDFYKDALGLNGQAGNAATMDRFQAGPGYEFAMNQGLDALDRRAAAKGQLNSGNSTIDTLTYAQGLGNQEFGSWLDRLQGFDSQQNQNYVGALGGQAGALGGQADLSLGALDRRLNVGSEVLNGRMGANNALADAKSSGASMFGSILGGGMKLLGGYL